VEQTGWNTISTGPFSNLNTLEGNGHYWTDTEVNSSAAWSFGFYGGAQTGGLKDDTFKGWTVYDGDVSTVPVPAAVWLFGSGLVGLVAVARSKKAA
jgi:hypothetical protein